MIYVMSDLHGCLDHFEKMLKKIKFNNTDILYIIGDVIDRGSKSIELIKRIMSMSNVYVLLGNHEHMMLTYYEDKEEYDKCLWYSNGGYTTDSTFCTLSQEEQVEILDYLRSLPIEYKICVNNVTYLLVHANYITEREKKRCNCFTEYKNHILWSRVKYCETGPSDFVVVFGHTQTYNYNSLDSNNKMTIWKSDNLIGLDCGLASYASKLNMSQLGCICLDTLSEFYVCLK